MVDVTLHLGDCLEYMRGMPDGCVDAVITDPPYGVTLTGTKNSSTYEKLIIHEWRNDMLWIDDISRLLIEGGPFYIFTCDDDISDLRWKLAHSDLRVCSRLTWIKTNPLPSYQKVAYRNSTEIALYGNKGHRVRYFKDRAQKDLLGYWFYPIVGGKERSIHPTQKPLELISEWIENSTLPGYTIFDPFMGSGTTGVAAVQLGRNFIGCEIDPTYFAIAEKRIKAAQAQLLLPLEM